MKSAIISTLLLSGSIAWAADPAPANAPVAPTATASTSPLQTPAGTADSAWSKLQAAKSDEESAPENNFHKQYKAYLDASRDFVSHYPSDPRAIEAFQDWLRLAQGTECGLTDVEIHDQINKWTTDTAIPVSRRMEIRETQIMMTMMQARSPAQWDGVEKIFADIDKQFGSEEHGAKFLANLRRRQFDCFIIYRDSARYQALLQKLQADPRPAMVAVVKEMQARDGMLADLKARPVELKFTAVDGTPVDLATLRGKVVLLDFWATWCDGCCQAIPNIVAVYKKYHGQGFEVISISLDQDKNKLISYTGKHEMVWPEYFDGKGWKNEISTRFGIKAIPAMLLFGKDGKLITLDGALDGQVEKALKMP